MEANRSIERRRRTPLADCTNTVSGSSQSSSSRTAVIKSSNPSLSSAIKRIIDSTRLKESVRDIESGVSTGSAVHNQSEVVALRNPSSAAPVPPGSTPSRTQNLCSDRGSVDHETTEPYSVYTRRKTAEKAKNKGKDISEAVEKRKIKGKAASESVDCLLASKISSIGGRTNEVDISGSKSSEPQKKVNFRKLLTYANKKSKKVWNWFMKRQRRIKFEQDDLKHTLPQDFIDRQRAYFAEVDAFELPEEEVTSIDELE